MQLYFVLGKYISYSSGIQEEMLLVEILPPPRKSPKSCLVIIWEIADDTCFFHKCSLPSLFKHFSQNVSIGFVLICLIVILYETDLGEICFDLSLSFFFKVNSNQNILLG